MDERLKTFDLELAMPDKDAHSVAFATHGEGAKTARSQIYDPQWIDHHFETR
jgi:hypothetical protein